jgi:L-lactate dehydrogenase complex protein LldG
MKESTSREKVLKNIRNALINKTENPYPYIDCESNVYNEQTDAPEIVFVQEFTKVAGKFVFCENTDEFISNLQQLINQNKWDNIFCNDENLMKLMKKEKVIFTNEENDFLSTDAGITTCEYLISRLGSIMVSSKQIPGRRSIVYPPVHIVVAYMSQIVPDLKEALAGIQGKYSGNLPSLISIITGPSRTADIEKTLVMGAHGPKEIYCFLIDNSVNK